MTAEEMKAYQHNYWLATVADKERHAALLKRRRGYYKHDKLSGRQKPPKEKSNGVLVRCTECGTYCKFQNRNAYQRACSRFTQAAPDSKPKAEPIERKAYTSEMRSKHMKAQWAAPNNPLGRPTVWNKELRTALRRDAKKFQTLSALPRHLGIDRRTIKREAARLGIELNILNRTFRMQ